jgi:hypothetical protein
MGRRRNGARVGGFLIVILLDSLQVTSLQVHDTMEGVLGLMPVLLSPAGRSWVL